jgi:two-component sensor histidine kinase
MFGVTVDITERKEEERVRAELREKEVLLKEIHHRVKNNLQIVSSLLKFQSRAIHDPAILELYRESQLRIQSMALIHEKLYQSRDLSWIDFGEYTRSLSNTLLRSYAGHAAGIRLQVDADPLALDVDRSVPCGLILTELISNCLKHAFPNGRAGEIHVGVHKENGRAVLSVRDDGVGMPPAFDLARASSLGLQLAASLTSQLGGELKIHANGGTEITLHFDAARSSGAGRDSSGAPGANHHSLQK